MTGTVRVHTEAPRKLNAGELNALLCDVCHVKGAVLLVVYGYATIVFRVLVCAECPVEPPAVPGWTVQMWVCRLDILHYQRLG